MGVKEKYKLSLVCDVFARKRHVGSCVQATTRTFTDLCATNSISAITSFEGGSSCN